MIEGIFLGLNGCVGCFKNAESAIHPKKKKKKEKPHSKESVR